jgi:cell division protein FtsB
MALWHVIVGLMTFWIVVLLFMGSSLHQANNEISEDVEQRLFEAMQKLDELKKENKRLKLVAADLK